MAPVVASPATRLDRPALSATVDAIARASDEGAGSLLASEWTGDVARELGDGRNLVAVAENLADRVRATVVYAPHEYAGQDVQPIEETLEDRRAGDCVSFTVAMCSLLRRAGLRCSAVVYEEARGEEFVPVHVLPAFEDPSAPDRWVPVELTRDVPFGLWPAMGREGRWINHPMQERYGPGVSDIFGSILSAGLGILGIDMQGNAQKKIAKENRKGSEAIAKAQTEAADKVAQAQRDVANVHAETVAKELEFGREALGVLFKVGLIVAGVKVLTSLASASRSSRRSPAAAPRVARGAA